MAAILSLFRHATRTTTPVPDAELLDRFAAGRDEEAFAELVRRHGPVVYRVCRRLVGPDAADDAFQATFLVLATRLDAARAAESVGGWLVGAAGRVARQMRRAAGRRARHETAAAQSREIERSNEAVDLADQFRVLDEELARLPDRLRDPVVLCLFQGRTQEQAAAELGRDARTLRRRLERAKQVLRARLERRGVIPVVAAGLVVGAGSVSAALPQELDKRTMATVFDFLTGGTASAASAPVVLAKGVAMTMFARKVMGLMVAATVGMVGLGVGLAGDGPPVAPPVPPTPVQPMPAPVSAPIPPAPPQPVPPADAARSLREFEWRRDEAKVQKAIADAARSLPAGERQVLVKALCVRVPAGFCERSGLTVNEGGPWILSQREARMLSALFRSEPSKEVVAMPQLVMLDNQAGFVQTTQQVEVVTGLEAETRNGATVYSPKVAKLDLGMTLKVTPRISADGKYINLRVESNYTDLAGSPVQIPVTQASTHNRTTSGEEPKTVTVHTPPNQVLQVASGGTNVQSVGTTVTLPPGGTVVLNSEAAAGDRKGKPSGEVLWVLTVHVIQGQGKADSGKGGSPIRP